MTDQITSNLARSKIALDCPLIPDKGNLFEKREDCKCIDFEDQVLTAVIPEDSTFPPSSSTAALVETSPTDPELVTVSPTTARPCICNRMLRPVCGANRKTYPNPCLADCEGVTIVKHCGCGAACDLLSDYDVIDDSSTTEAPSIAPPLTPDVSLAPQIASADEEKVIEYKNDDLDEEVISTTKIPSIEDITELELDLVRQLEAFEEDTPDENDNEDENLSAEINEKEIHENEVSDEATEEIDEISSVDEEEEVEDESEGDAEGERPKIFINENGDLGITTKGLLFYLII